MFCPLDKPKFDGNKCVACVLPSFWNITAMDCDVCKFGRTFDPDKLACVCPNDNSFFNGTACI